MSHQNNGKRGEHKHCPCSDMHAGQRNQNQTAEQRPDATADEIRGVKRGNHCYLVINFMKTGVSKYAGGKETR